MKSSFFVLLFLIGAQCFGAPIEINTWNSQISVSGTKHIVMPVTIKKGELFQFYVMQDGLDVELLLISNNKDTVGYKDTDNGTFGHEVLFYEALKSEQLTFYIKKLEGDYNPDSGAVSFYVKKFTKKEKDERALLLQQLAEENKQNVLTADIDHFWMAFDKLVNCKNYYDSISAIQNYYFDLATNGFLQFIKVRDLYAPEYLRKLTAEYASYADVRENTYMTKEALPLIETVFDSLKIIYPNFKPFQVCFAIGALRTGGTTTSEFILIGTELTTTGEKSKIPQRIKGIVAHEAIHTQQKYVLKPGAVVCNQLDECLDEGVANFIGELITGTTNYGETDTYGYAHEAELWNEFKSTLCAANTDNWLYNGGNSNNRPADLGYFIGYRIAKTYYQKANDKKQAVIDLIAIDDPLSLLAKSGYDGK
ncbi:MAG: DUF2268 domain-containing putative Zn-dependent protease [Saprospiraceae bacterium]|jgi:hypothetical protein|nr:DUF2268 domain-containing putative Zn-dependent protease [Saprospiraceae bacterium]